MVHCTILPTKSDSDVIFCLQLLCKTLTYTLDLAEQNMTSLSLLAGRALTNQKKVSISG